MTEFAHLFSPLELGATTVKNRLFFPPHGTSLVEDGKVGDRLVAYHEARAKGGVGLIIVEGMSMHPSFDNPGKYISGGDPDVVPGFARLARTVHGYDCKIFGQLFHPGSSNRASADGSKRAAFAPSDVPHDRYGLIPFPAPNDWIWEVIDAYGRAGGHMREAGFDGVEVLASMGYLVAQFLNPRTNLRDDEFGGSFENRMRFLIEVLKAIRARTDEATVIGIRVSADALAEQGLHVDETMELCTALDRSGMVDYINVIGGYSASASGWLDVFPPMAVPHGHWVPHAAALRRQISKPVLVGGRINQPQLAERIVAEGEADMVGVARALICDPEFAAKAEAGRSDDIRACIGCNQACVGHRLSYYPVSCIQHPETGREPLYPHKKTPAPARKKVLVVGGGPGGMKAAAVAAERGHDVTLVEKEGQLGGQTRLAQMLPGREEFGGIVTNFEREISLAGVTVERNTEATAEMVRERAPDAVILATGAVPRWPEFEGAEEAHAVDAWSVIRGEANVGGSVLVADWSCDWIGIGVAEKLARDGCRVRLAVNGIAPGAHINEIVRDNSIGDLHKLGVEVITHAGLYGADSGTVYLQHTINREPIICEEVDTLVLAQGHARVAGLARDLDRLGIHAVLIGDALSPRTAEEAVLEGLKAAMEL
jgi:2,4-dienoyl-CoA reductase-like NADH-dependent reductase (Old Yellow Enzyme family)